MVNITTTYEQTPFDIAIQYYGSIEKLDLVFSLNEELSFDKDIPVGTSLVIDENQIVNEFVINYLKQKGISLSTGG